MDVKLFLIHCMLGKGGGVAQVFTNMCCLLSSTECDLSCRYDDYYGPPPMRGPPMRGMGGMRPRMPPPHSEYLS